MKSRRVPWVRLFSIAAVLCVVGAVYGRVGLFPGSLLDNALAELERVTHKKIACERIVYIPFRGFTLDKLKLYGRGGELLFSANSLTVNARVIPFFRDKKIIIDRFVVDSPVYDYSLDPEPEAGAPAPKTVLSGQIEVPVAGGPVHPDLKSLANGPDFFLPENVYLQGIEITNGVLFVRKSGPSPVVEEIQSINIRMGFQKPPILSFEGQIKLGGTPYATVDLEGRWDLKNDRYDFRLNALSRKVPEWLIDYQKGRFLTLKSGEFSLKARLLSGRGGSVLFQTESHLKNALMLVSASQFTGTMHLAAQGAFDTAWKRFEKYKGSLELVRVDALRLSPKIERLDDLSGKIAFEPDLLTVQSLSGEYMKLPFTADGSIRSFKELVLKGSVRSRLTMAQLLALLPPEAASKMKDFKVRGECEAVTTLSGTLKSPPKISTETAVRFENASVQNAERHIDWSGLSGELKTSDKGYEIARARLPLPGTPVEVDAFIPKDASQPGWFRLVSKTFDVRSSYTAHGNDLWLQRGSAALAGTTASFQGKLLNWTDPTLQLEGTADISLKRLAEQMPALAPWSPEGSLKGPFVLNGPWRSPIDWEFKMDAEGPFVRLKKNFLLEEAQVQIRMKNRILNVPYVHALSAGGTLGARLLFDLGKPGTFFDSRVYLNNADLAKVGRALDPPKEELKGTLIAQNAMRGTLGKPESWRGQGAMSITNGYLGKTTQFKAMGKLPLVKVEGLDVVTFHGLSATYEIRDKKLHTKDLTLMGDTVNLSLHGTLSFDSQLDMIMNIQYSEDVYRGAADTGGIVPMVLQQAGNLISDYHVHGSLNAPKYDKKLMPVGRSIGKSVGGILQEVVS